MVKLSVLFLWIALIITHCGHKADSHIQSVRERPLQGPPETVTSGTSEDFALSYVMGKFDPDQHPGFTLIDSSYADRSGMYLRKDAYAAFIRMYDAAQQEGLRCMIRSATRNFAYQKGIWERKWNGETRIENGLDASLAYPEPEQRARMILKYSSMPGTSRHHWGTDIDLNSFENAWFAEGEGLKLYQWLRANANRFGFCQPYTDKALAGRSGYEEEKWHWSYFPVAVKLTQLAKDSLRNELITGFQGAEAAPGIDVVGNYVLGVSSECLLQE